MPLIQENDVLELEELRDLRVLLLTRKPVPVDTGSALVAAVKGIVEPFTPARRGWGFVYDARAAKGRNDPAWESAMNELQHWAELRFGRVVLLVATAAGALQLNRAIRENGWRAIIARDRDEAIALAAADSASHDAGR